MVTIQDCIDSYFNGQKKQMVNQIREYGASSFFVDLAPYVNEFYSIDLYVAISIAYHQIVNPGMLVT